MCVDSTTCTFLCQEYDCNLSLGDCSVGCLHSLWECWWLPGCVSAQCSVWCLSPINITVVRLQDLHVHLCVVCVCVCVCTCVHVCVYMCVGAGRYVVYTSIPWYQSHTVMAVCISGSCWYISMCEHVFIYVMPIGLSPFFIQLPGDRTDGIWFA